MTGKKAGMELSVYRSDVHAVHDGDLALAAGLLRTTQGTLCLLLGEGDLQQGEGMKESVLSVRYACGT